MKPTLDLVEMINLQEKAVGDYRHGVLQFATILVNSLKNSFQLPVALVNPYGKLQSQYLMLEPSSALFDWPFVNAFTKATVGVAITVEYRGVYRVPVTITRDDRKQAFCVMLGDGLSMYYESELEEFAELIYGKIENMLREVWDSRPEADGALGALYGYV